MSRHRTPSSTLSNELEVKQNIFSLHTASHWRESSILKPILFHCFTQAKRTPFQYFL